MNYYIAKDHFGNLDIIHYGVKGMKWGIRRYQNKDGSLTAEGRRKARKEYKEDNQKAFHLGRDATITGKALIKSNKKMNNFSNSIERAVNERLKREYSNLEDAVEKHHAELVNKYGDIAVSNIKHDKYGNIKERVASGKEIASSIIGTSGLTMLSAGFYLLGAPFIPIGYIRPRTAGERGRQYYKQIKKQEKNTITI